MEKPIGTFASLFWSFFKIGGLTFGGGYAMIPVIRHEIVERRRWISSDEFLELLALAQSSPGPISLNTAVFVGYKVRRYAGAVTAVAGTVLPAFAVILLIAVFFRDYARYPLVESAFRGMRPAVVALIVAPVFNMLRGMRFYAIAAALVAAALVGFLGVSPVWFLLAGAVGGALYAVFRKENNENKDRAA
jgi:chromate transporter